LVAAWRRLRSGESKTAGWCWFLVALAASLGANVATAGLLDLENVPAWLRILVAGWPAVAFLGGTLLAHGSTNPSEGSVVPSSTYYRVWQEARLLALPPAVAASPLASRPYDLRHSALST
jgi:hypothetical protein